MLNTSQVILPAPLTRQHSMHVAPEGLHRRPAGPLPPMPEGLHRRHALKAPIARAIPMAPGLVLAHTLPLHSEAGAAAAVVADNSATHPIR